MTILISSLDTFSVLESLASMLKAFPSLIDLQGSFDIGEEVNQNPDKAPWAGIYEIGGNFPSRTLGFGNGFRRQELSIAVVVQNVSRTSGSQCLKGLTAFRKAIVDCILSDTCLGGKMDVIDGFQVFLTSPVKQGSQATFQSAVIQFTAVSNVGASGG